MKNMDIKQIYEYNVWDFLNKIQEAIHDGYVLSNTNEHFPQIYIGSFSVTLVKPEDKKEITETKEPVVQQLEEEVKEVKVPVESEEIKETPPTIGSKRGKKVKSDKK